MNSNFWQQQLVENIVLIVIQIIVEFGSYYQYKKIVTLEKRTYFQFLDHCYTQSVFNQELDTISASHQIYELNPLAEPIGGKQQFQNKSSINYEEITLKNEIVDIKIDEEQYSQFNSSQQLKNHLRQSFEKEEKLEEKIDKKHIVQKGKGLFYLFYFAISICLPFSIIKALFYYLQESQNSAENRDKPIIQYFILIRIFTDLENFFDYFCFIFIALMIQSQGIFIKLIQDYYQNGISNMIILVKCQIKRSLLLVSVVYLIQQVFNVYFILIDQTDRIALFSQIFYSVILFSLFYRGQFAYSNEKAQKDKILFNYYNNFYEKHFNYVKLIIPLIIIFHFLNLIKRMILWKNIIKRSYLNRKMFVQVTFSSFCNPKQIKQKQLETNHQFKDLVFNQGIYQQVLIKALFIYFVLISPIFLVLIFYRYAKGFILEQEDESYFASAQKLINFADYITQQISKNQQEILSDQIQIIYHVYNSICYLLLIGLKYFIKQKVFFNATAYGQIS